jgi:hypothetical protein
MKNDQEAPSGPVPFYLGVRVMTKQLIAHFPKFSRPIGCFSHLDQPPGSPVPWSSAHVSWADWDTIFQRFSWSPT